MIVPYMACRVYHELHVPYIMSVACYMLAVHSTVQGRHPVLRNGSQFQEMHHVFHVYCSFHIYSLSSPDVLELGN